MVLVFSSRMWPSVSVGKGKDLDWVVGGLTTGNVSMETGVFLFRQSCGISRFLYHQAGADYWRQGGAMEVFEGACLFEKLLC